MTAYNVLFSLKSCPKSFHFFFLPSPSIKQATRNGVTLPAGTLYMSFTLWNKHHLSIEQARKKLVQARAKEYLEEKENKAQQYKEETNIIKKALLFRQAAVALDKATRSGILSVRNMYLCTIYVY